LKRKNKGEEVKKRVEYQKYVRLKLEHKRHRKLLGLTDNIVLIGEEDIVLQREFRIDFVLQMIDVAIHIVGIFDYFREYNLLEFKSINDRLDMVLVDKYIGQLFWWLFSKRKGVKEGIGSLIKNDEVTLTVITVGNPRNAIKELKDYLGEEGFDTIENGIYQWEVMGVLVRLIVINKLDVRREHYGWLIFSEGEKYNEYKENLIEESKQDDSLQVYLELLNEIEKEGKERMADEILQRIFADMPIEKKEKVLVGLPDSGDVLQRIFASLPIERKEKVVAGLPDSGDVLQRVFANLPIEKKEKVLAGLPVEEKIAIIKKGENGEGIRELFAGMPIEKQFEMLKSVPVERQRQLSDMLQRMLSE